MTNIERKWFEALAADREENARTLMKASMRGVWRAIVDKYSDQAHFVYELLQNADDAGATEAIFKLERDRLLFKHNGTRRFSITSPEKEEQDFASGHIGDLNSITGAGGFSTKWMENTKGNVIGKFGVGFKAVFQYTTTPEVYDDNMSFRLKDYIVPRLIEKDEPWRNSGETLFVFPLDKPEVRNPHDDIWKKLNSLIFPTLFLNNLKTVRFSDGKEEGSYSIKEIVPREEVDDFYVRKVSACSVTSAGKTSVHIWMFDQTDDDRHKYEVGFVVDSTGKLKPVDYKAFCYFPTKHDTKLKFIIHAPFLLTDSREGIKANEDHNTDMILKLADLSASALEYLCRFSEKTPPRIVTDDVLRVIPVESVDYGDGISFDAFRDAFETLFYSTRVVPTSDSYVDRHHGYWAESKALPLRFTDSDLSALLSEEGAKWAFPTIPKEHRSIKQGDAAIFDFIGACTNRAITDAEMIRALTVEFVANKGFAWLEELYKWIAGNDDRIAAAKKSPIFLDQHGNPCAAFDVNGKKILFLPLVGDDRYQYVNANVLKNSAAKKIIREYGLEEPSKADYIQLIVE